MHKKVNVKSKAIPCDRLWRPIVLRDVEASTFSTQSAHNGGEFVSLKRRPHFTPKENYWHTFLLEAESNSGL
jgi:hypothetical protein